MSEQKPWEDYASTEVKASEDKPWEDYAQPKKEKKPWEDYAAKEAEEEEPGWLEKTMDFLRVRGDPQKLMADIQTRVSPEERAKLDAKAEETPLISGKAADIRILPSEIEGIARRHRIPANKLRSFDWAAFFGAPEATGSALGEALQLADVGVGFVSEAVGMGIPQKLAIEMQSDPNYRAALEDLRTLALYKRPATMDVAELVTAVATGFGAAKAVGKAAKTLGAGEKAAKAATAATGVGESVVGSLAGAEAGYEQEAAKIGLAFGGALAAIPEVYDLVKSVRAKKAMQQIDEEIASAPDTVTLINQEVAKHSKEQELMDKVIDRVVASKDYTEVETFATDLNNAKKLTQFVGGQQKLDDMADEIMNNLGEEARRKTLSELKDARLIREDGVITFAGRASIVQKYLDVKLSKMSEKLGGEAGSLSEGLQRLLERSGEGADALKQTFTRLLQRDAHELLISQSVLKKLPPSTDNTVLQSLHQLFADAQFVFRDIDRKTGMRTEVILNKMNNKYNAFTRMLGHMTNGYDVTDAAGKTVRINSLQELDDMREKAGLDFEQLYKILDNPKTAPTTLTPEQIAAVQGYRNFFAYGRKEANKLGLNIQDFTQRNNGYVPHMTKENVEVAKTVRNSLKQIQENFKINLLDYTQEGYKRAEELGMRDSLIYRQLKDALDYLEGKPITNVDDMTSALYAQINPRTAGMRSVSNASATYRRSVEQVPELIRETNINRLAARWTQNTFRHAFLRDGFAEMEKVRDMLVQRGYNKDAEYITNWLTDNLGGVRRNTWRAATQEMANVLLNIRDNAKADSQLARISGFLLDSGPHLLPKFFSSVYPNFLGFNIRSALQNASQPLLMAAPELGARGYAYAGKAYANIVKNNKEVMHEAKKYTAAQWNTELVAVLEAALKRSAIEKGFDKVSDKYTKLAMGIYELAERSNRAIVVQMGKELVKDMADGNTAVAKMYLKNLNVGMRNELMDAFKTNNTQLIEELVINNLLDKTVFQYNKLAMSNFGRVMGPVLSVFSKWPTAIAGDVIDAYRRQGMLKGSRDLSERYLAPFAVLAVLNYAATGGEAAFEQPDPQIQAIIGGKKGLTGLSPLQSLTQGVGVPPLSVSAGKFAQALASGDVDKMMKAAASVGDAYIPVLPGVLRTANDVSKLTTGEEFEWRSLEAIYSENAAD